MKTLYIQIQPDRASDMDKKRILEIGEDISSNKELVSHFEIQEEGEKNESWFNLLYETNDLKKLWRHIKTYLFNDTTVGMSLSQSSIAVCEGEHGWDDYLLLYHFNKLEELDSIL